MLKINYWAVVAAAVSFFVIGGLWYSPLLLGNAYAKLRGITADATTATGVPIGDMVSEIVRGLVVAYVLARLLAMVGVTTWLGAAQVGLLLWIGFPVMILLSSVVHEGELWQLAAIHSGDWLVKLVFMAILLGVWR